MSEETVRVTWGSKIPPPDQPQARAAWLSAYGWSSEEEWRTRGDDESDPSEDAE